MSEAAMAIPMHVFLRTDAALLLGIYIYLCQLVVSGCFPEGLLQSTHTHIPSHTHGLSASPIFLIFAPLTGVK